MCSEIYNQFSIGQILNRFPRHIRQRWDKKALKSMRTVQKYPNFSDFVDFVEVVAIEAGDPLYGVKANSAGSSESKGAWNIAYSDSNFYASPSVNARQSFRRSEPIPPCVECGSEHHLFQCALFKAKRVEN